MLDQQLVPTNLFWRFRTSLNKKDIILEPNRLPSVLIINFNISPLIIIDIEFKILKNGFVRIKLFYAMKYIFESSAADYLLAHFFYIANVFNPPPFFTEKTSFIQIYISIYA